MCEPGQQGWWDGKRIFVESCTCFLLRLTYTLSQVCRVVVCKVVCCSCLLMLLLMLLLPATSSYFLVFPTTSSHSCYFLLFPFAYFSWFQPGRPVPPQTARFYLHSFNFEGYLRQWVLLLTFLGFSLAAQNLSRLYDFTSIPSILSDIASNGCLLFAVSAWPPRTPPDCTIYQHSCNFERL